LPSIEAASPDGVVWHPTISKLVSSSMKTNFLVIWFSP
jgi:hypothetical protein